MKKKLGYTITETEVSFGDALFRLYRFGKTQDYTQKASHIPILHKHPFYEIMLCTAYGYRVVTEDSDIFLLPNNFLLVNPQKLHCAVGSVGKPPLSFGILLEEMEGTVALFRQISDCLQAMCAKMLPLSPNTRFLFEEWQKNDEWTAEGFCQGKVLAYRFLYAFLKDISALGGDCIRPSAENKTGVSALLDTLLDDRRYSLKEIADALGYTRKHTLRLIQKRYGCDYRTVKKKKALEAAKTYLGTAEEMSVAEIACALGYASESAFYAFFKGETGQTPLQYRKKLVKERQARNAK